MTEDFSNINRASNFIFLFRSIEASVYAGMFILCFLFAATERDSVFLRGGGLVNFHTITLWLQDEVTRKLRNYTKK